MTFSFKMMIPVLGAAALAAAGSAGSTGPPSFIEKIAFTSMRDHPTTDIFVGAEIYLMNPDGTGAQRLTNNAYADIFAALSPNGKKIVFDSTRNRIEGEEPDNTSDLFLMKANGEDQTLLTRGSSASWSANGESIAFHASASGSGLPINDDPGAATSDSDIFIANVNDLLENGVKPTNLTNDAAAIDEDSDWSPDGEKIAFTSYPVTDVDLPNKIQKGIYVRNADGTGDRVPLTSNVEEERSPSWSPDGTRIVFSCRRGPLNPLNQIPTFEICVMDSDGTNQQRLTDNRFNDLTPTWSPDGQKILFHRGPVNQLWLMNADGTGETQLTFPPFLNGYASWGVLRVHGQG